MVDVVPDQGEEVDQPVLDVAQRCRETGKMLSQSLDAALLERGVVGENGPGAPGEIDEPAGDCFVWIFGPVGEPLVVGDPSFRLLPAHAELDGHLVVGTTAIPDGYRQSDGFEVEEGEGAVQAFEGGTEPALDDEPLLPHRAALPFLERRQLLPGPGSRTCPAGPRSICRESRSSARRARASSGR